MRRRVVGAALLVAAMGLTEAPANAFPEDQTARGNEVWSAKCERCHGPEANEPDAPKLMERGWFRGFLSAATAQKYIKESMPNDEAGTLTDEQTYDVLAFLLKANGVTGEQPLGPETAPNVPIKGAP
jgi:cytochrome c